MPTRFVLTPFGSRGDVHPFLAVGRALAARGDEVVVLTYAPHEEVVRRAGLGFEPLGTVADYERGIGDPDLWHPRRGLKVVMGALSELLEPAYEALERLHRPGHTVLVGHTLALVTRVFEERHGVPAATVHLSPNAIRSLESPPLLPPAIDPGRWPRWVQRAFWWLVDRTAVDPLIVPALDRLRRRIGLPPVRRVFGTWLHAPRLVLGLFPPWFVPPPSDWPPQVRLLGFVRHDEGGTRLPAPLERFLDAGSAPVVVTPGSANVHGEALLAAAVAGARALGRRAVVVAPSEAAEAAEDGADVLRVRYAPFAGLLPRAAAIVHHGGIGTIAESLAAGVPQVITPFAFDQPDNARRAAALGVATVVRPGDLGADRLARALGPLLEDASVRAACDAARTRMAGPDAAEAAADHLGALVPTGDGGGR